MQLKTILNHIERHKSFVYGEAQWADTNTKTVIEIPIEPRANGRPDHPAGGARSKCGCKAPGYDRLSPRRFGPPDHPVGGARRCPVPVWGITVFFVYAMRRADCRTCGVTVEQVPWCDGKHQLTTTCRWFLAGWAKRLCWQGVAEAFGTTWQNVYRSVKHAVSWGLAHRNLSGIESIGVDEVQWRRGHKYLTLAPVQTERGQIDDGSKRLLWIGKDRTTKTFLRFFRMLGKQRSGKLKFVCSDMWKPYLKVIAKKAAGAIHVLDRFPIMQKMPFVDENGGDRRGAGCGSETFAGGRLRAGFETLAVVLAQTPREFDIERDGETLRTAESTICGPFGLTCSGKTGERFWEYVSPAWAGKFLDQWCTRTMRSRIEPMKKVARTLRNHRALILNWFRAKGTISSGTVEGLNNKMKLTTRKSYGFRTYEAIEIALYHNLGRLPEPEFAHRFW